MVTFRNNNNRRNNFRRNDRNFKSNGDRPKYGSNFSNNDSFQRKAPGRNNHNAPKLIEKYNNLAREALSSGDKILSENYFQHADHFTRVQNEQESLRMSRVNSSTVAAIKPSEAETNDKKSIKTDDIDSVEKNNLESSVKKVTKSAEKKTEQKKSAVS